MVSHRSEQQPTVSPGGTSRRALMAGTIRYVILAKDDSVETKADPEIFLRVAGRGRIAWRGHTGRDRSGAAILLPPRSGLTISGHLRALRVAFPGLPVSVPVGPVSDVLVNLLCSRAWRSSDAIAETSLALVRLLILEEVAARAPCDSEDAEPG